MDYLLPLLSWPRKPYSEQEVAVSVRSTLEEPYWDKLKLDDSLPTIRDILKLDKKLLFLNKGSYVIKSEIEEKFKLREIVKEGSEGQEKNYQLHLKLKKWEYLNVTHRL